MFILDQFSWLFLWLCEYLSKPNQTLHSKLGVNKKVLVTSPTFIHNSTIELSVTLVASDTHQHYTAEYRHRFV
jgi:hypothetical protein